MKHYCLEPELMRLERYVMEQNIQSMRIDRHFGKSRMAYSEVDRFSQPNDIGANIRAKSRETAEEKENQLWIPIFKIKVTLNFDSDE
jgi:hypothetical protein